MRSLVAGVNQSETSTLCLYSSFDVYQKQSLQSRMLLNAKFFEDFHWSVRFPVLELLMGFQPEHADHGICTSLHESIFDLTANGGTRPRHEQKPASDQDQTVGNTSSD